MSEEQAMKNIQIIAGVTALGLPLEMAELFGARPLSRPKEEPRKLTDEDRQRIEAAELKRQRKAAKRLKPAE